MATLPFTTLKGDWSQWPVYILGGGPSLMDFDFSRLFGAGLLVGVNKGAFKRYAPSLVADCDVMVTLDQHFVRQHRAEIQAFVDEGGEAILIMPPSENGHRPVEGATYLYRRRNQGLSDNPADIYGVNSGYAALNAAYLMGAKEIGLLGFDMARAADGRTHHHEGYAWHNPDSHRMMDRWATNFEMARQQLDDAGVHVTNFVGTPRSKVTAFETAPLSDL